MLERERLATVTPELLVALVCSGANVRLNSGREDGLRAGAELHGLDLSGCKLAVLSACETALGESREGEGAMGLCRSLRQTGARRVIGTLWKIPDTQTSVFFKELYEKLWAERRPPSDALRLSKLAQIDHNRKIHGTPLPWLWGALVLFGDWN